VLTSGREEAFGRLATGPGEIGISPPVAPTKLRVPPVSERIGWRSGAGG
jgi:hypothetical protein